MIDFLMSMLVCISGVSTYLACFYYVETKKYRKQCSELSNSKTRWELTAMDTQIEISRLRRRLSYWEGQPPELKPLEKADVDTTLLDWIG